MKSTKLSRWIFWGNFILMVGVMILSFLALYSNQSPILIGIGMLGGTFLGIVECFLFSTFVGKKETPPEMYLKENWEQIKKLMGGISCQKSDSKEYDTWMNDPAIQIVNANQWETIVQIIGNYHGMDYILQDVKTKFKESTGRETVLFQGCCIQIRTLFFPPAAIHVRTTDYFSESNILPEQTLRTPLQRYYPAFFDTKNGLIICTAGKKEQVAEICTLLLRHICKWEMDSKQQVAFWLQPDGTLQLTIRNHRLFDYGMAIADERQVANRLQLLQDYLSMLSAIIQ